MPVTSMRLGIREGTEHDMYGGLSGLVLEEEQFELGQGIVLSRTYAHLMAHYVMAFTPAPPGQHHPAPWKTAGGGTAVDITAELFVPATCHIERLDNLNTIWWIVALLRLKAATTISVSVVSSERFSNIPNIKHEPHLGTMETPRFPLRAEAISNNCVGQVVLEWIRCHWQRASALLSNQDFLTAFMAVDSSIWNSSPALGLVSLWGALERLFSVSTQELSFRVSANIAAYLESPGTKRYELFKHVKRLYDHRSKAAHGDTAPDIVPYQETYALARRIILKIVETHHVPVRNELESLLFGASEQVI
jgi:hypothetical protein